VRSVPWLPLALALFASPATAAGGPRLTADAERGVVLSGLPPILAEPEVRSHLMTGLTTTLLFRLDPQWRAVPAGARVEVRYELWDEVFHVAVLTADGRAERMVVSSFEELDSWWRQVGLVVLASDARTGGDGAVRLVLDVIPFSQAERDDTKRWFSETIGATARSINDEAERAPDEREESLGRVLSVMIATSIQRRALTSYEWALQLPRGGLP
jgi:hypothetical protein